MKLWNARIGQLLRTLTGHPKGVDRVVFSPDGTTLTTVASAFNDSWSEGVKLWNVASGTLIANLGHAREVNTALYSPNGATLATTSWDHTAKLWNGRTGQPLHTLTGHTDNVATAAFSPDGTTLATASHDKTARLWNTRTGAPTATLTAHTDAVRSVTFSADGRRLATIGADDDDTARLWGM